MGDTPRPGNLIDLFHSQPGLLQEVERQLAAAGLNAVTGGIGGTLYNALRVGNKVSGNALGDWISRLTNSQQPANQTLGVNDPDYGNPNYIGLGDPVDPTQGPTAAPAASPPSPAGTGMGRPVYTGSDNNAFNAWRSPFSQTYQQALNPGSAIGPVGGGTVNPYHGQFVHPSGGTEMSPLAAAYSNYIKSRNLA